MLVPVMRVIGSTPPRWEAVVVNTDYVVAVFPDDCICADGATFSTVTVLLNYRVEYPLRCLGRPHDFLTKGTEKCSESTAIRRTGTSGS